MNTGLFFLGIGKVLFGLVVGGAGIFLSWRALGRFLRMEHPEKDLADGNIAAGILQAAALIALGILGQQPVAATFNAMDLLYRGHQLEPTMAAQFALYGCVHVAVSLVVGTVAIRVGVGVFGRLTRDVDELAEVRRGNTAPALVLGAAMIVMALLAVPGLQNALEGLLPLPTLARDEAVMPS